MPYFLIDTKALERNLRILKSVEDDTGCRILLAQKCFSCYALYPLMARYLHGATSSGVYEARLCHEHWPGGERHVFAPAFSEEDFQELLGLTDHIVFNSPHQLRRFASRAKDAGLQVGLRVNPQCSTQQGPAIYDPCAPGSRLGTTIKEMAAWPEDTWQILDGIHFHTLCEQDADALETTLDAVEAQFRHLLGRMKWINFGGGHHITRPGYDLERLKRCIQRIQERYGLMVYLEPGEAVALNAGELHCRILEIQPKGADGISNVILDTSAACHMPDVLEMPYTPPLMGATAISGTSELAEGHVYRLGGPTCLSGDVIGTYRFTEELHEGNELVFQDMAIYSMVKTNTFNGMPLPEIRIRQNGAESIWKRFCYQDFKSRI